MTVSTEGGRSPHGKGSLRAISSTLERHGRGFCRKNRRSLQDPWLIKIWQNGRGDPPGPV
jgi:hypothetical protein